MKKDSTFDFSDFKKVGKASVTTQLIDKDLAYLAKNGHKPSRDELYFRYSPFVNKHWTQLKQNLEKVNNAQVLHNLSNIKEDFVSDSFLAFDQALNYLNLNKIQNDKWKFLGVYGFYLSNLRRSYRRKALRLHKEVQSDRESSSEEAYSLIDNEKFATPSAEDTFFEDTEKAKAHYFEQNLDEFLSQKELDLVYLKRNGNTVNDIKQIMNIDAKEVKRLENSIKDKIHNYMTTDV